MCVHALYCMYTHLYRQVCEFYAHMCVDNKDSKTLNICGTSGDINVKKNYLHQSPVFLCVSDRLRVSETVCLV